jgi:hypothetical protein
MLDRAEDGRHQEGVIILATNLLGHQEVRCAPNLIGGESFVRLERDASHVVGDLSESAQASFWIAIFIKVQDALVWVGHLAEKERE